MLCPHCFFQVLNKIDLPGAEPDRVSKEIEEVANIHMFALSLHGCLVNLLLEYYITVCIKFLYCGPSMSSIFL